jgi:hypothetical protein
VLVLIRVIILKPDEMDCIEIAGENTNTVFRFDNGIKTPSFLQFNLISTEMENVHLLFELFIRLHSCCHKN